LNKRSAFTFLETLIVLAIVTIIFTAMGMNVRSLQNEAKISKAVADLKLLQVAIESYYKNYMYEFPPAQNYQNELYDAIPRILEGNLIDPFGPTTISLYSYSFSQNKSYYVIYSLGVKRKGYAVVDDGGAVSLSGDPIWISNGHR
jgi:type II secretory pathway pseudopilin PulG